MNRHPTHLIQAPGLWTTLDLKYTSSLYTPVIFKGDENAFGNVVYFIHFQSRQHAACRTRIQNIYSRLSSFLLIRSLLINAFLLSTVIISRQIYLFFICFFYNPFAYVYRRCAFEKRRGKYIQIKFLPGVTKLGFRRFFFCWRTSTIPLPYLVERSIE